MEIHRWVTREKAVYLYALVGISMQKIFHSLFVVFRTLTKGLAARETFTSSSNILHYLIQMEKLSVKLKASKNASMGKNRFAEFAYKPARVFNIPFGLETTTSNILSEILASDGSLTQSVAGLMAQAKASGTMEN
jgi:hypothetical protein